MNDKKNIKGKNRIGKPRRIQFEAHAELADAIDRVAKEMCTTASFICRVGLTIFMQDRGFIPNNTMTLLDFITPCKGKSKTQGGRK